MLIRINILVVSESDSEEERDDVGRTGYVAGIQFFFMILCIVTPYSLMLDVVAEPFHSCAQGKSASFMGACVAPSPLQKKFNFYTDYVLALSIYHEGPGHTNVQCSIIKPKAPQLSTDVPYVRNLKRQRQCYSKLFTTGTHFAGGSKSHEHQFARVEGNTLMAFHAKDDSALIPFGDKWDSTVDLARLMNYQHRNLHPDLQKNSMGCFLPFPDGTYDRYPMIGGEFYPGYEIQTKKEKEYEEYQRAREELGTRPLMFVSIKFTP